MQELSQTVQAWRLRHGNRLQPPLREFAREAYPNVEDPIHLAFAVGAFVNGPLSGVNLSGVNLTGANLTNADLSGANLTNADLTGANLTGANLTDANLTDANLEGADLSGATCYAITAERATFTHTTLLKTYLADANLRDAKLDGARMDKNTVWSGATTTSVVLTVTGLPSGRASVWPISTTAWLVRVGCWSGTLDELRTLIAQDDDWPEALPHEIRHRRPLLEEFCATAASHIAHETRKTP